jgi:hypothetical protein
MYWRGRERTAWTENTLWVLLFVVFLGFRDKPRMNYRLDGLLYRPIWTFQVRPPDASTLAEASRTLVAEVGTLWAGKWSLILPRCRPPRYILGIFYMAQICDMGPTALLPFRRKACWGFFRPLKIRRLRPGLNPPTWVPETSTLTPRPPKPLTLWVTNEIDS